MSATEAPLQTIDLDALETWLDDLPKAEDRRKQDDLAIKAADQLEELAQQLGEIAARLPAIQEGLEALSLERLSAAEAWRAVEDTLRRLPEPEVQRLASFAESLGRTSLTEAVRLAEAVDRGWRGACERLARDAVAPLRTLSGAMSKGPAANRPKADALGLLIHGINKAKDQLIGDPTTVSGFLLRQKGAQEYLARELLGAADPGDLVRRLADGEVVLGSLSEQDLAALRRSALAQAISLKL